MAATDHSDTSPSALLGLPPEMRNMIWRFAVIEGTITLDPVNGEAPSPPTLLEVSRQIRAEAIEIYYHENRTVWLIRDLDAAAYTRWQRATAARLNETIEIIMHGKAVWKNLVVWLQAFYEGHVSGVGSSGDNVLPMVKIAAQMFDVV